MAIIETHHADKALDDLAGLCTSPGESMGISVRDGPVAVEVVCNHNFFRSRTPIYARRDRIYWVMKFPRVIYGASREDEW